MAWIAFAGLNLAVLGAQYRNTRSGVGLILATAWLGVAYLITYLGVRVHRTSRDESKVPGCVVSACLALIGIGITVIGIAGLAAIASWLFVTPDR